MHRQQGQAANWCVAHAVACGCTQLLPRVFVQRIKPGGRPGAPRLVWWCSRAAEAVAAAAGSLQAQQGYRVSTSWPREGEAGCTTGAAAMVSTPLHAFLGKLAAGAFVSASQQTESQFCRKACRALTGDAFDPRRRPHPLHRRQQRAVAGHQPAVHVPHVRQRACAPILHQGVPRQGGLSAQQSRKAAAWRAAGAAGLHPAASGGGLPGRRSARTAHTLETGDTPPRTPRAWGQRRGPARPLTPTLWRAPSGTACRHRRPDTLAQAAGARPLPAALRTITRA